MGFIPSCVFSMIWARYIHLCMALLLLPYSIFLGNSTHTHGLTECVQIGKVLVSPLGLSTLWCISERPGLTMPQPLHRNVPKLDNHQETAPETSISHGPAGNEPRTASLRYFQIWKASVGGTCLTLVLAQLATSMLYAST